MEGEILKYGWLIVLTLAQIVYIWIKMAEKQGNKKRNNKPDNPHKYGERIVKLETEVMNIKDDIREIKGGLEKIRRPGK